MRCSLARCIAWNGLRCHGTVLDVLKLIHHRRQLTGVHLQRAYLGFEIPWASRIGIKLHRDRAGGVYLRISGQLSHRSVARHLPLGDGENVDAQRLTHMLVDGNQRIAKGKHSHSDHQQFGDHLKVGAALACVHSCACLSRPTMPSWPQSPQRTRRR